MAWIAEVVFFGCYALGYFLNMTLPHNVWSLLSALAAAVIAILLIVENRASVTRRP